MEQTVILKITEYWEVASFCGPAHHIWDSIYWFPGTGQCTFYKLRIRKMSEDKTHGLGMLHDLL